MSCQPLHCQGERIGVGESIKCSAASAVRFLCYAAVLNPWDPLGMPRHIGWDSRSCVRFFWRCRPVAIRTPFLQCVGLVPVPRVVIFLRLLEVSLNHPNSSENTEREPGHSSTLDAPFLLWGSSLMLGQKWWTNESVLPWNLTLDIECLEDFCLILFFIWLVSWGFCYSCYCLVTGRKSFADVRWRCIQ